MNFTREPIIETVITPREGCKLVVRSSKGNNQEDYFVDAVEVVSFGHSFFFRSMERPKSFLVPVSDYEILELKETRMVLKNVGSDRSIKIGGGRETPVRHSQAPRDAEEPQEDISAHETPAPQPADRAMDKKRGRRSRRRRGSSGEMRSDAHAQDSHEAAQSEQEPYADQVNQGADEIEEAAPSFISKLFPPPPTLIKETLGRYKTSEEGIIVEGQTPPVREKTFEAAQEDEPSPLSDADMPPSDEPKQEE